MQLLLGDCIEKMKDIEGSSIDMVMTSPPYDNLRDYGKDFTGWGEHIWKPVLDGVFRVLKDGGMCVWVVNDATINGSETGTSFKQALYWMEIGGKLHDTMIWKKVNPFNFGSNNAYIQSFEYMFILSKGKPKTYNFIYDRENVTYNEEDKIDKFKNIQFEGFECEEKIVNKNKYKSTFRKGDFMEYSGSEWELNKLGKRHNVWDIKSSTKVGTHTATFPLQLPTDHIISWSNEGDTVLDPFMGSGTTGVACIELNRNFIGIELDENYFNISVDRINKAKEKKELSFFVVE